MVSIWFDNRIASIMKIGIDTSFYTALYANGRVKENALISPTIGLQRLPVIFVLFKMDYTPLALSWASLITYALLGCIVKPIMIVKLADYTWKEILQTMYVCLMVTLVAVPIPLVAYSILNVEECLWHSFSVLVISLVSVAASIWFLGLTKNMKEMLLATVKSKLNNR